MAPKIDGIEKRRTNKSRVEYLVNWRGQKSTWETRVDLIEDGHQAIIKDFEAERKKSGKSASSSKSSKASRESRRSVTPSRSRSRSRASRGRASATPKSTSKQESTPDNASSIKTPPKTRTGRSKTPKAKSSTRRSETPSRRRSTSKPPEIPVSADTPPVSFATQRGKNDVSEMVGRLDTQGWVIRVALFVLLIASMLANALIPEIKKGLRTSPHIDTVISMLEKTTAIPPLVCLLLVLHIKDTRNYNKFVEVCMVWRTAAEVLLQLPDPSGLYESAALAAIGFANFAAVVAVCSIMGGSQPKGDALTQALGTIGALILFGSDGIMVLLDASQILDARFLIMSIALVMMAFSTILQHPL